MSGFHRGLGSDQCQPTTGDRPFRPGPVNMRAGRLTACAHRMLLPWWAWEAAHMLDSAGLHGAGKLLTSPTLSHPLLKPWGLPFVSFQPPLFKNALWSLKLSSSYRFLKFPCYYYAAHPSAQPWDLWLLSLSTFNLEQLQWQLSGWPWCLERESEVIP